MGYVYRMVGKVDSANASQLERELFAAHEQHGTISLDASCLEYISSAGLRALMRLCKEQGSLEVTNVSQEVYAIFEITGFTELLQVKRQLRQISIDGCALVGRGGNGSVYRISDDEIVKVYSHKTPVESIEQEREFARSAFVAGVPTAIPFDMVRVKDSLGLVFEMVKADVIARKFMEVPEEFDEYAQKYAELFRQIHSVSLAGTGLPKTSEIYSSYLDGLGAWYSDKELDRLGWFIRQIPERDTMVHGDFHPNNIMVQGTDLLIIDMAEISCGNPIFDLASSYYAHMLNPRRDPKSVMRYLNVTPEIAMRLWDVMVRVHFQTDDQAEISKYNELIEGFCMLKGALVPAIWVNMPKERKEESVQSARERFFPEMERLLEGLSTMR